MLPEMALRVQSLTFLDQSTDQRELRGNRKFPHCERAVGCAAGVWAAVSEMAFRCSFLRKRRGVLFFLPNCMRSPPPKLYRLGAK